MVDTLSDFAVVCYARAGVAECCLRLQDGAGADVNMLLTAAWLAGQNRCWQPEQVRELIARCADWREHCILPLRAGRRYLKNHAENTLLYEQIKTLELDAETFQLRLLHAALQAMPLTASDKSRDDSLAINLQTYFASIGIKEEALQLDQQRLIAALSQ